MQDMTKINSQLGKLAKSKEKVLEKVAKLEEKKIRPDTHKKVVCDFC